MTANQEAELSSGPEPARLAGPDSPLSGGGRQGALRSGSRALGGPARGGRLGPAPRSSRPAAPRQAPVSRSVNIYQAAGLCDGSRCHITKQASFQKLSLGGGRVWRRRPRFGREPTRRGGAGRPWLSNGLPGGLGGDHVLRGLSPTPTQALLWQRRGGKPASIHMGVGPNPGAPYPGVWGQI